MKITTRGAHVAAETDLNLPLFPEETSGQPTPPQMFGRQQPRGTSASPPIPLSLAQVSAKWKRVARRLGRHRPVLELILAAGLPVRLVEQTLIVGFSPHRRFQRELLEVTDYRVPVEEELSRMAEILNVDIARRLEGVVWLLKEQGANPYRGSGVPSCRDDATLAGASGDGDSAAGRRGRSPEVAGARRKPDANDPRSGGHRQAIQARPAAGRDGPCLAVRVSP